MSTEAAALVQAALGGSRRALARLLTLVEDGGEGRAQVSRLLFPHGGRAWVTGFTGAPGAGKSTLVGKLAALLRARGERVAILAVDPTSPFSGGALLGDRIRMGGLDLDQGVFLRSMGTRGALGGLSTAAEAALRVFDACGYGQILIETVGVGQSEVDVAQVADTVAVLTVPGLGDDVQMDKAGILEIGDLLVVNKADRDGARRVAAQLRQMQGLAGPGREGWVPPILLTEAQTGRGVDLLLQAMDRHRAFRGEDGRRARTQASRLRREALDLLRDGLSRRFYETYWVEEALEAALPAMLARETDPWSWAGEILARAGADGRGG